MKDQGNAVGNAARRFVVLIPPPDTTTFPFLTLPAEIRNMIYRYILCLDNPLQIDWYWQYRREERQKIGMLGSDETLKLVRLCKQIYHEALPIYFGENTFEFIAVHFMGSFLKGISDERRNLMRNISFEYGGKKLNEGFDLLQKCANLEKLHVGTSSNTTNRARGDQRDLCNANGLKSLLKVRGCKEVTTTHSLNYDYRDFVVTKESVERFQELVKTELCKERKEVKKRKPKGQGKKALAGALKAAKGNEGGHGNGSVA